MHLSFSERGNSLNKGHYKFVFTELQNPTENNLGDTNDFLVLPAGDWFIPYSDSGI